MPDKGTDTGQGGAGDTPATTGIPTHLNVSRKDVKTGTLWKTVLVAEGKWSECNDIYHRLNCCTFASPSDFVAPAEPGHAEALMMVSGVVLDKRPGGRAAIRAEYTAAATIANWGLDWASISKPIRTWGAGFAADGAEGGPPNLAQLAAWEAYGRDDSTIDLYSEYKYTPQGDVLTGNTLKLAKMIREDGIEYYQIYRPVCTITRCYSGYPQKTPKEGNPGTICAPLSTGWTAAGADDSYGDPSTEIPALANKWLKIVDRSTPNTDGTYTRVEQWQGADDINEDLYPTAGGGTEQQGGA